LFNKLVTSVASKIQYTPQHNQTFTPLMNKHLFLVAALL